MSGRSERQAEQLGNSGAEKVAREASYAANLMARAVYKRIMETANSLRLEKQREQSQVAEVGRRLVDASASTITTERDRLEASARKPSDSQPKNKPLIDYAQSPRQKALLLKRIDDTQKQFEALARSDDPIKATEAREKVAELAKLMQELGPLTLIEEKTRSIVENSTIFSDKEPSVDIARFPTNEARSEEVSEPLDRESQHAESMESGHQERKSIRPEVIVRPSAPPPLNNLTRRSASISAPQKIVVETAVKVANYEDPPTSEPNPETPLERYKQQPADIESKKAELSPHEVTLVSVYKSETFKIERKGFVVSIFDATGEYTEPIFSFEQRGAEVIIHKDEITTNPEIYRKFERVSQNLETLRGRGIGTKTIFADKTYQKQAAALGELAPRGSTAIATASLITNDAEQTRSVTSESGTRITYERQVHTRPSDQQQYEVFRVSQDGVDQSDSVIAVAEDGTILMSNPPSSYLELRENYKAVREEVLAAQQAEGKVDTSKERDRGDEGR